MKIEFKPISVQATACPSVREVLDQNAWVVWMFWLLMGIAIGGRIFGKK